VPERFNFAALLKTSDDRPFRRQLLKRIETTFSDFLVAPTEVFLLEKDASQQLKWPDAGPLLESEIPLSSIFVISYASVGATYNAILSVSRQSQTISYTMSLPDVQLATQARRHIRCLSGFYSDISSMAIQCIVVAGAEVEIDASWQTIDDVIVAARRRDSLVELLCCDSNDARSVSGLVRIASNNQGVLFERGASHREGNA
jgi:hypothetical protein